tara:strand:- start:683 stop:880 length:198 start_codon:yes stop_codon:yes gene_type:complete
MSKNKKEIKQEDLKEQLKQITDKHNEAIQQRAINDELAKRCLGAMEVLQGLIEEEDQVDEVKEEK